MLTNYVKILKEEKAKGNAVIFNGISSKVGCNGNLVLNALILKSDELNVDTFSFAKKDLVKASAPMTICKLDTALRKLTKSGFISITKKNEFPYRIYYTIHKKVVENAVTKS